MAGEMMEPEENTAVAPQEPTTEPPVTEAEKKIVTQWLRKIKAARKHWDPVFKRMKKCQQIAAHGAYKEWLDGETRYVVPILNRHINLSVAQLYAKNPSAVAEPRRMLRHKVWDGTQEQVQELMLAAAAGDLVAAEQFAALQQDILIARNADMLAQKLAQTTTLLYQHQVEQQPYDFKTQIKALVRRTKVNSVGYLRVGFVREMEPRIEATAQLEDSTSKAMALARLAEEAQEDNPDADVALEQAASVMQDFQEQPDRLVREQLIFDYPRSTEIILDPGTRHLKSLLGTKWLACEFNLTADEIEETYKIDIDEYLSADQKEAGRMLGQSGESGCDERTYKVYVIQDKRLRQVSTVCEGCDRFLRAPQEPDVFLERFFDVFPLVFNEIESDEEVFPPSDVWAGRHMQFEYNRSRDGLREHRIAARPYWLAAKGRLGETDKASLSSHAAHEVVEITPDGSDTPLSTLVEPGPTASIDPNLYEVAGIHEDLLRTVGAQEANLGGTSGATATETSIAENSRMASQSDNVDDLDDFLTEVARASGQILFRNMNRDMVLQIVGPGAVWPDAPPTRQQAADEISLRIRAGSSGRPNQAADLANLERAWPALSQLPGVNPEPLGHKYAALLDIDPAELLRSGVLSITAQNAMARAPAPAASASAEPTEQGSHGGDNAERPVEGPPGAQPAFPAPGEAALRIA